MLHENGICVSNISWFFIEIERRENFLRQKFEDALEKLIFDDEEALEYQ